MGIETVEEREEEKDGVAERGEKRNGQWKKLGRRREEEKGGVMERGEREMGNGEKNKKEKRKRNSKKATEVQPSLALIFLFLEKKGF